MIATQTPWKVIVRTPPDTEAIVIGLSLVIIAETIRLHDEPQINDGTAKSVGGGDDK